MKLRLSLAVATFASVIAQPTLAGAQSFPTYHVTELASPADRACVVTALNDAGVAAGSCAVGGGVVWRDGNPASVGLFNGGTYTQPTAINSAGVVVGDADANFSPRPQAFVTTPAGLVNVDPTNGGNARSIGVMDNGFIFGNLTKSLSGNTSSWNVILWTPDPGHPGRYRENALPKLAGGDPKYVGVYAAQSNKVGQVVGWVTNTVIGQLGGFWNNDDKHTVAALQALPGGNHSIAWAVNDLGQAAGESNAPDSIIRAVLWQNDAAHTPVDVGMLPGDTASVALGVNSVGQVVGMSLTGSYPTFSGQRAFVWQNGAIEDLALLIDPADGFWTVDSVVAINNAGQIVATGTANGRSASILLTPIAR
jgi:probable HAF family extracellular repeat protein